MTLTPLDLPDDNWRSRWLVLPSWNVLHRIAEIAWEEGDTIMGTGLACCGAKGHFTMPGLFSRVGLKRCTRCCRAAGVPPGAGNPRNADIVEGATASPAS